MKDLDACQYVFILCPTRRTNNRRVLYSCAHKNHTNHRRVIDIGQLFIHTKVIEEKGTVDCVARALLSVAYAADTETEPFWMTQKNLP